MIELFQQEKDRRKPVVDPITLMNALQDVSYIGVGKSRAVKVDRVKARSH